MCTPTFSHCILPPICCNLVAVWAPKSLAKGMQKKALPPRVAMVITNNECGFSGSSLRPTIGGDSRRWHSNGPTNPSTGQHSAANLDRFLSGEVANVSERSTMEFHINNAIKQRYIIYYIYHFLLMVSRNHCNQVQFV